MELITYCNLQVTEVYVNCVDYAGFECNSQLVKGFTGLSMEKVEDSQNCPFCPHRPEKVYALVL